MLVLVFLSSFEKVVRIQKSCITNEDSCELTIFLNLLQFLREWTLISFVWFLSSFYGPLYSLTETPFGVSVREYIGNIYNSNNNSNNNKKTEETLGISLHYFRERLQVSPITYCASSNSPRLCLGSGLWPWAMEVFPVTLTHSHSFFSLIMTLHVSSGTPIFICIELFCARQLFIASCANTFFVSCCSTAYLLSSLFAVAQLFTFWLAS